MNLSRLVKLELFKLIRRKDVWSLFTMLLLPLMYATAIANHSKVVRYVLKKLLSCTQFTASMYIYVSFLFLFFILMSICVSRTLSSEVHDKSMYLYLHRIKDRKLIYVSKNIALMILMLIVSAIFYLFTVLCFYFIMGGTGTTGEVFCYPDELIFDILQFLQVHLLFVFVIQMSFLLGTYLPPLLTVGISTILIPIFAYLSSVPILKYVAIDTYMEPLYKVTRTNVALAIKLFLLELLVVLIYTIIFNWFGWKKFKQTDM